MMPFNRRHALSVYSFKAITRLTFMPLVLGFSFIAAPAHADTETAPQTLGESLSRFALQAFPRAAEPEKPQADPLEFRFFRLQALAWETGRTGENMLILSYDRKKPAPRLGPGSAKDGISRLTALLEGSCAADLGTKSEAVYLMKAKRQFIGVSFNTVHFDLSWALRPADRSRTGQKAIRQTFQLIDGTCRAVSETS